MLEAHLNPDIDAASRPEIIDKTVSWLLNRLKLSASDTLLDLGCGPGLYCQRFAARGLLVTGVDLSRNSINYAREHDFATRYLCQNYLNLDLDATFKAVTLIYGDFCVLSGDERACLLETVYQRLDPGGYFVLDVSSTAYFENYPAERRWSVAESGCFWKPAAYVELFERFRYPEHRVLLDQYAIIEADSRISVYRNWFQCYSPESIESELTAKNFVIHAVYRDLMGNPYASDSEWIGIVAGRNA
jgi:SAM-dependent methyltransferase